MHCQIVYERVCVCATTEKCQQHLLRMIFALWLLTAARSLFLAPSVGRRTEEGNKINKHLMKSQFIGSAVFIGNFFCSRNTHTQHVLFSIFLSIFNQSDNKQYLIWVRCTWSAIIIRFSFWLFFSLATFDRRKIVTTQEDCPTMIIFYFHVFPVFLEWPTLSNTDSLLTLSISNCFHYTHHFQLLWFV